MNPPFPVWGQQRWINARAASFLSRVVGGALSMIGCIRNWTLSIKPWEKANYWSIKSCWIWGIRNTTLSHRLYIEVYLWKLSSNAFTKSEIVEITNALLKWRVWWNWSIDFLFPFRFYRLQHNPNPISALLYVYRNSLVLHYCKICLSVIRSAFKYMFFKKFG